MAKPKETSIQEWIGAGFKSLIVCVISLGVFVFNNLNQNVETSFGALNKNIEALTSQLKTMEGHQVETDKRVSAIEVAREINGAGYQKLLSDVADLKSGQLQNSMRLQTLGDFMAKHFK